MMAILVMGIMTIFNSLIMVGLQEQSRKDALEREEKLVGVIQNLSVVLDENAKALKKNAEAMDKINGKLDKNSDELSQVKQDVQDIKNILEKQE
jgi:methyl-accepting chemotaxis protein